MIPLPDRPNQPGTYAVRYKVLDRGTFGGRILATDWADELGVQLDGLLVEEE